MKRHLAPLSLLFAHLCLLFTAQPAQATSMRHKSLRELVRGSDVTLLGHPIAQQSFWQGTRIMTRVQVQVDEVWAGPEQVGRTIEVVTAGGVVGTIGQRVDGAAVLPAESRLVLHLKAHEGEYWPVAMAQGVWLIRKAATGEMLLRPGADRLVAGIRAAEAAPMPQTLSALRAAVQEVLDAP